MNSLRNSIQAHFRLADMHSKKGNNALRRYHMNVAQIQNFEDRKLSKKEKKKIYNKYQKQYK